MASGLVIHIVAGNEKRTEFFADDRIRVGADDSSDLQLQPPAGSAFAQQNGMWLELRRDNGHYHIAELNRALNFEINNRPLAAGLKVNDGDMIKLPAAGLSFTFFPLQNGAQLVATNNAAPAPRRETHFVPFIEHAALESAASPRRDDALIFLREFLRELVREITWTTKLVALLIVVGTISGLFYLGFAVNRELERNREVAEAQRQALSDLEKRLSQTSGEITNLDRTNQQIIKTFSLVPTLRNEYGNGVCLLVGTYDLVDRRTGRQLRYPDPNAIPTIDPLEPTVLQSPESTEQQPAVAEQQPAAEPPLTTEGNGSAVEFDFVGTGFHVGSGYVVTNRHVVQPWTSDDRVKVLTDLSNGRVRLRRLVVYFPGFPNSFPLRVADTSSREDLAVARIDPNTVFPVIPTLPLDADSDATAIGKTVVTMGYPNGPDRILAMVDESEARTINARYGQSLQNLVGFLAQTKRVQPLTTQGTITDLDNRSIVHDARTAEGGSGAPLFGQSGRVIGVNFGVFTGNTAANMAVPIRYAIRMLERAGWRPPDSPERKESDDSNNSNANNSNRPANANINGRTGNTANAAASNRRSN